MPPFSKPPSAKRIVAALVERDVFPSDRGLLLQPVGSSRKRRDQRSRGVFRVWQDSEPRLLLQVGRDLAAVHARHAACAAALPTLVAPPAFHFSLDQADEYDLYGQDYIQGETLEERLRVSPDDPVALNAFEALAETLDAGLEPSTAAAAMDELAELGRAVAALEAFSSLDQHFLADEILPLVGEGILAAPPVKRWSNGDLTASNILLDRQGQAWLTDFEFARQTHFHLEDWLRFQRFSDVPASVRSQALRRLPRQRRWVELYFWLRQIVLEERVNTGRAFEEDLGEISRLLFASYGSGQAGRSLLLRHAAARAAQEETDQRAQLFLDLGEGFSELTSLSRRFTGDDVRLDFDVSAFPTPTRLRFDPVSEPLALELTSLRLTDKAGETREILDFSSNGQATGRQILFASDDPQIHFLPPEGFRPQRVIVEMRLLARGTAALDQILTTERAETARLQAREALLSGRTAELEAQRLELDARLREREIRLADLEGTFPQTAAERDHFRNLLAMENVKNAELETRLADLEETFPQTAAERDHFRNLLALESARNAELSNAQTALALQLETLRRDRDEIAAALTETRAKAQAEQELAQANLSALEMDLEADRLELAALARRLREAEDAAQARVRDDERLDLAGALERQAADNRRLDLERHMASERVRQLEASLSWRITAPLRAALDLLFGTGRLLTRPFREIVRILASAWLFGGARHQLTPVAVEGVGPGEDGLESTALTEDPYYLLASSQGRLPAFWVRVEYWADWEDEPVAPKIYPDDGSGFRESSATQLPPPRHKGTRNRAYARLPLDMRALRFDPTDTPSRFTLRDLTMVELGAFGLGLALLRATLGALLRRPWRLPILTWKLGKALVTGDHAALSAFLGTGAFEPARSRRSDMGYSVWVQHYDSLDDQDREAIRQRIAAMPEPPRIAVLMPVYNPPEALLRQALDSVRAQLYPHWELCVADDKSTAPHVRPLLEEYAALDARIKVAFREENGHISRASNTALDLVTADWTALMDHDDELREHALYVMAEEILAHPEADLVYSDEDKIDEKGRRFEPHFKPDFSPDLLHAYNYFCHLSMFRTALIRQAGGFRVGYEGSQDYDLTLRVVELSAPERVRHAPMVLYHWRSHSGSTAQASQNKTYAQTASVKALEDHFRRLELPVSVQPASQDSEHHRVVHPLPNPAPLVSVIIPTRNRVELLAPFVKGILRETDYPNVEVLILDNDSDDQATLEYFAKIAKDKRVRIVPCPGPFNYSVINNIGAREAKGELLALCNNDLLVISPGWLRELASQAMRPEVGAVGAKLYYADERIQHAGVILGLGGVAGHSHKYFERDHPGYFFRLKVAQNLSAVTAACLVTRREVFEQVGGLNERDLKVAFNDVDLCLRIRQAGYLVVWTPFAELYHLESVSRGGEDTPEKQRRFTAEVEYMLRTWGDLLARDPYYNPNLTIEHENFSLARQPRVRRPWHSTEEEAS